nr:sugar transferase [Mesorhizobium sp.]
MLSRLTEASIAMVGLVLSSPVVLAAAVAVRATSPGPALLVQERVGRGEAPFRCLKLRTMWKDTRAVPTHEASAGAITPVGRLLRRTKLDELPQLWNVLKGEMSFVGPRPCLLTQETLISARRRRGVYALRPGITGLAQVRGVDMSDPERLAAIDAEYLERRSVGLDLRILLATLIPGVPAP